MNSEKFLLQKMAAEKYLDRIKNAPTMTLNYVVPNDLSKKLRSLMLIGEDLNFIKKMMGELLQIKKIDLPENNTIETALWHSIIVKYGKGFMSSQSGFSWLKPGACFVNREELAIIQNRLMDLRHRFIAHREESPNEQSMVFFKITKERNSPEHISYQIKTVARANPSLKETEDYILLFDFLSQVINEKIEKEAIKVCKKLYELGKENLLQLLISENHDSLIK